MIATEMVLPHAGAAVRLEKHQRILPAPARGQVIVRVEATGVSFAEQQMRRGRYYDQPTFPFVPGYDFIGKVAAVGEGVALAVGQRVAGLTKTGAWSDHLVGDAADLTLVADELDPAEAEAVVLNGVTAWRLLHMVGSPAAGRTIVIHGANGGVGSLLVQLARRAGFRVIGTASARNTEAVRSLGAVALDRHQDLLAGVRSLAPDGVAAVFDHVAGPGLRSSWSMLAPGGVLVVYGVAAYRDARGDPMAPVREAAALMQDLQSGDASARRALFFNIWEGRDKNPRGFRDALRADLGTVLHMLAEREIRALVAHTFALDEAFEALNLAESGRIAGKVVLVPHRAGSA
ncbi:MAG TPA: zinc-binding dehydrogenase [Candidatus Dormibacteraeota bacterium]|nr:zinc-binding dehydrogenase [Candidatus Dormibacteraeota bacterium]